MERKEPKMNECELRYVLSGIKGLHELLNLITEITSEIGMTPDVIKYRDGRCFTYNSKDAKALSKGTISEDTYITRNQVL